MYLRCLDKSIRHSYFYCIDLWDGSRTVARCARRDATHRVRPTSLAARGRRVARVRSPSPDFAHHAAGSARARPRHYRGESQLVDCFGPRTGAILLAGVLEWGAARVLLLAGVLGSPATRPRRHLEMSQVGLLAFSDC